MKSYKTYACYMLNDEIRLASSSGGVFSALAAEVLSNNGVVYGVAMTSDCYGAEFIRVDDIQGLALLRGSKYLQAEMGETFKRVKKDLLTGKKVLFSGTACQVNGLKKFLLRNYENLITVDVICHGVPSPGLWRRYAKYQEKKFGSKLERINFRCKEDSWEDFGMKENEVYISKDVDPYMQMFLRDYCLRPSCYNCAAKKEKLSDLTIADFWGISRCAPSMNDGKGTSLLIVRTEKGSQIFAEVAQEFKVREVSYAEGVKGNPSEYKSVPKPKEREAFFDDMRSMEFDELAKKYASYKAGSMKTRIKKIVKRILLKVMRGGKRSFEMNYGLLFTFQNEIKR